MPHQAPAIDDVHSSAPPAIPPNQVVDPGADVLPNWPVPLTLEAPLAMAMRRIDRLALAVHDASPPTDAEWDRWLGLSRDQPGPLRVLVETHGGGPNAKQRKALSDELAGRDLRSAILTESLLVRGFVTALGWVGISLRAFPLHEYAQAAAYLQLTSAEVASALDVLRQLRAECGTDRARIA